jgi:killing trait domain-containing protein
MAYPTSVNSQITDAVTQQGVSVLANAPAMAMGTIYQSAAHSISILYQNATQAQHQAAICAQAATNQGVIQIYSVGSMAGAVAATKLSRTPGAALIRPKRKLTAAQLVAFARLAGIL